MIGSGPERLRPMVKELFIKHEGKVPDPIKVKVMYDVSDSIR